MAWTDPLEHIIWWTGDMRFGTWNVTSLYSTVSLPTVAMELARCKLYLVGVQEVEWNTGGTARAGNCFFFYGKGNNLHHLGTGFWKLE